MKSVKGKVKNLVKDAKEARTKQVNRKVTEFDKKKFFKLHRTWSEANGLWSNLHESMKDETYDKLRNAFTDEMLAKLIFDYVQRNLSWIIMILPELTGHELEIPDEAKGNIKSITDIWLEWARSNSYLDIE